MLSVASAVSTARDFTSEATTAATATATAPTPTVPATKDTSAAPSAPAEHHDSEGNGHEDISPEELRELEEIANAAAAAGVDVDDEEEDGDGDETPGAVPDHADDPAGDEPAEDIEAEVSP